MAEGGSPNDDMDQIAKQLNDFHLNVMDQDDNYV